jgi:hypothetical protein
MFRMMKLGAVKWPVTIRQPIDGGFHKEQTLDVVFDILSADEHERVIKKGDLLERVFVGIDSTVLPEEGDAPIKFKWAKAALLQVPYARAALLEAYYIVASGEMEGAPLKQR